MNISATTPVYYITEECTVADTTLEKILAHLLVEYDYQIDWNEDLGVFVGEIFGSHPTKKVFETSSPDEREVINNIWVDLVEREKNPEVTWFFHLHQAERQAREEKRIADTIVGSEE